MEGSLDNVRHYRERSHFSQRAMTESRHISLARGMQFEGNSKTVAAYTALAEPADTNVECHTILALSLTRMFTQPLRLRNACYSIDHVYAAVAKFKRRLTFRRESELRVYGVNHGVNIKLLS